MITLNIYVAPLNRMIQKNIDPLTDTPAGIVNSLLTSGQIPPPPNTSGGGVTIWKMTKVVKQNDPVDRCLDDLGFVNGETVYLIPVP
ncbi:MAG: hypothetical protein HQ542_00880 [Bacteroidia bacterium]|nr:hypothetical protein [Bacteroidia bacterium]